MVFTHRKTTQPSKNPFIHSIHPSVIHSSLELDTFYSVCLFESFGRQLISYIWKYFLWFVSFTLLPVWTYPVFTPQINRNLFTNNLSIREQNYDNDHATIHSSVSSFRAFFFEFFLWFQVISHDKKLFCYFGVEFLPRILFFFSFHYDNK